MANIQEIVKPSASTVTTLYTWTGSEIISTISVSNTWASSTVYSIYFVPSWESYWDTYAFPKWATILGNELITFTLWITPKSWTVIQVVSTSWDVTFMINWQ